VGAYLIVLFVVLIGTIVVRRRMLRGPVPPEPVLVDPYLAAYLAGGPDRVTLTVLAEMVDDSQLAVDRRGRVTVVPGDTVRDPMRVAVLRGFRGESRVSADALYRRATRQPEMRAYAEPAVRRGLRYEPAHRRLIMIVPVPLLVLAIGGIALLFAEIRTSGPNILILMPLIIIAGIEAGVLSGTTPTATPVGRQALRHVARHPDYAVATRGGPAIKDGNLGYALFPPSSD